MLAPPSPPPKRQREWMPKFWDGICFGAWWRLLLRNRFRVSPRFWWRACLITLFSLFHSVWRQWQFVLIGWRARRTPIVEAPLFIIGHWRSGTTLLHEMLVLDPRHTYPT